MSESNGSEFLIDDGIMLSSHSGLVEEAAEKFEQAAVGILQYARANAPWADRTGMARAGLQTSVFVSGEEVVLELYHTAEHGLWLEVIQDGAFATIMPTLEQFAPMAFASVNARITSQEDDVW